MDSDADDSIDLEQRFLCADDGCIGIIGSDGRCKLCSTPIAPEKVAAFEQARGSSLDDTFARATPASAADNAESDDAPDEETPDGDDLAEDDLADDAAAELKSRVLCSDGACIGVIGHDGRCKLCGKPLDDVSSSG